MASTKGENHPAKGITWSTPLVSFFSHVDHVVASNHLTYVWEVEDTPAFMNAFLHQTCFFLAKPWRGLTAGQPRHSQNPPKSTGRLHRTDIFTMTLQGGSFRGRWGTSSSPLLAPSRPSRELRGAAARAGESPCLADQDQKGTGGTGLEVRFWN